MHNVVVYLPDSGTMYPKPFPSIGIKTVVTAAGSAFAVQPGLVRGIAKFTPSPLVRIAQSPKLAVCPWDCGGLVLQSLEIIVPLEFHIIVRVGLAEGYHVPYHSRISSMARV